MKPIDQDLRFGQLAVRMGIIQAQELPKLLVAAQQARERSGPDARVAGLGQLLVRKKRLTVSEYLYVAREAERTGTEPDPELEKLDEAFLKFSSGELDEGHLAEILRSGEATAPRPKSSLEEAPPRFGRYELLGEIARGGMGIVYRAKDTQNGKIFALKVMIEADDDEARLARFEVEAQLAQKLDHPGIVKVHDAGAIDGMPFFTMDLVEGKSLDDLLEQGIERTRAMELLIQVARAVDQAHKQGIVHRDLKPGNILIENASGLARITDFGLAREMDRNTRITRVGQAVGTPYYMAPEQVRGERDVDGRADTYAIGVMLYEVLTGDVPFDADSALSLFKKIDREPVNLPLDPERGIDAQIHAIVMKCLSKPRDERYASSALLALELERYLKGRSPRGESNAALAQLAQTLARHRTEVGLAAAAAFVVVAAVAIYAGVATHFVSRRELDAGERDARAKLDRARDLVRTGEIELAASAPGAEDKAREAARLVREVELVAQGEGWYAKGERRFFDGEGGGARLGGVASALLGRADVALGRGPEAEGALGSAVAALPPLPDRAKLLLLLGRLRRARGDTSGALAALDDAVRTDAKDLSLLVERAEAKIDAGRAQDGIQDLTVALKDGGISEKDELRARLARARALLASAAFGSALDAAQDDAVEAARRAPSLAEPLLVQGDVLRARGQDAAALTRYQRASEVEPRSAEPSVRRGELLLARGSYAAAARAFDAALLCSETPRWDALLGRGQARARRFDLEAANEDLRRAVAAARDAPLGPRETPRTRERAGSRALVALAEVQRARGDASAARASLVLARRLDAEAPEPEIGLGRLDLESPPLDQGAAALHFEAARTKAAPDGPDVVDALEGLARVRLAKKDLVGAQRFADQALASSAAAGNARAARTTALVRSPEGQSLSDGAWSKAFVADHARETRGRAPDLATALLDRAWPEALAAAAYPGGEGDGAALEGDAELELLAVTRLDPDRAPAWLALAELRLARHRPEGARDAALRCAEIDPLRARAHELAALALLELARDPAATESSRASLLRLAVDQADDVIGHAPSAELYRLRAAIRVERGDSTGAVQDLEIARGLSPGDPAIEAEVARAKAATPAAGLEESKRILAERARDRDETLARAREALAAHDDAGDRDKQDERALALAKRASEIGSVARDHEVREALLLLACATRDVSKRLDLAAQALAPPDAALLDEADAALAPTWDALALPAAERVERLTRARQGDEAAATAIALLALEDSLAGATDRRVSVEDLAIVRRAAPVSAIAWTAHALAAVRAGDASAARDDVRVLARIAPGSALVAFVEAELAALEGDRPRALERLDAAGKANLALAERRTAGSQLLKQVR